LATLMNFTFNKQWGTRIQKQGRFHMLKSGSFHWTNYRRCWNRMVFRLKPQWIFFNSTWSTDSNIRNCFRSLSSTTNLESKWTLKYGKLDISIEYWYVEKSQLERE
jgi:hypothetical protein